ncbi:MAG: zf-HC2 domain-containing protein [Syntrophales bacterium]|nr:zf-HC2 domain-containing protein [Syntrophales bacterium]
MNCRNIRKRLAPYQDGELSADERKLISAHLQECPSCRDVYAEMEDAWRSLDHIREVEPSPQFYRNLSRKIHAVPEGPRLGFSWLWQLFPAPVATFAILLIGLSLGIFLGNFIATEGQGSFSQQIARNEEPARLDYFKAFAPTPPGSIGDGYLRLANASEEQTK